MTTFSLHLWNTAKSLQNPLTPPGLPPSDTIFPLFRLQRSCLLSLSPSSLSSKPACAYTSPTLSDPPPPASTTLTLTRITVILPAHPSPCLCFWQSTMSASSGAHPWRLLDSRSPQSSLGKSYRAARVCRFVDCRPWHDSR